MCRCLRICAALFISLLCIFKTFSVENEKCCSILMSISTSVFVCALVEAVRTMVNTSIDYQKGKFYYYAKINGCISQIENICSKEKLYIDLSAAMQQNTIDEGWNRFRIKIGELWKCAKQFADNDTVFIISREYVDSLRYIIRMKVLTDLVCQTKKYEILSRELFKVEHYKTTRTKMWQEMKDCFEPDPKQDRFLNNQKIIRFDKLPNFNQRWNKVGYINTVFDGSNDPVNVTEYYFIPAMELDARLRSEESKYSFCKVLKMASEQNDRGIAEPVYDDEVPRETDGIN